MRFSVEPGSTQRRVKASAEPGFVNAAPRAGCPIIGADFLQRGTGVDSSSIELPGSEVEAVIVDGDTIRVRFSRAYIIKTMTGSVEQTRWWQAGDLVFGGAEAEGELPALPAVCAGGDIYDNVFTYRDMIPVPLESRGRTGCDLHFGDDDRRVRISAETLRLDLVDTAKYIEHIRPG